MRKNLINKFVAKQGVKEFLNWIPNRKQFNALFSLNLKLWFKTGGIISSFIVPIFLLFIMGNIFSINQVAFGILSVSMFITILTSFGASFAEVRTTSLLKRIGVTPIRKITYMLVSIIFTSFLVIITLVWIGLWIFLTNSFNWVNTGSTIPGLRGKIVWTEIHWPGVITSLFINFLLGMTLVAFVASIAKTYLTFISIMIIYFFVFVIVGGNFFYYNAIRGVDFLKWFTRIFVPHSYANYMGYDAFVNKNPFDFDTNPGNEGPEWKLQKQLNISIPFVYIVGFFTGTFFTLKWDTTR